MLGARVEDHCPAECAPQGALQAHASAATVSILATTCDAVERLHAAVSVSHPEGHSADTLPPSSTLAAALEAIFQSEEGFLEGIDIQDIRLSVGLEEEELRLAANELDE